MNLACDFSSSVPFSTCTPYILYKSKVAVQKALNETQVLFDSLMQKYFG